MKAEQIEKNTNETLDLFEETGTVLDKRF